MGAALIQSAIYARYGILTNGEAPPMKLSARNQFKGRIKRITHGAVNSEVEIELAPGIVMTAQITTASVHALGLKEGGDAYAIVKADSVMVGVDH